MNKNNLVLIITIIILAVSSRLLKHPVNITPVAAVAFFSGWYFSKKSFMLIPLAIMFISDIFIGFYDWRLVAVVYLSMIIIFGIGWILKKERNWTRVLIGSISGSIIFFLLTNLAVWAFYDWYSHSWSGLLTCFIAALPFFKNTLMGDFSYYLVIFGAYKTSLKLIELKHKTRASLLGQ